jgi:hypothetical protein
MQVSSLPFQASVTAPRQAGKSPVNTLHFGTAAEKPEGGNQRTGFFQKAFQAAKDLGQQTVAYWLSPAETPEEIARIEEIYDLWKAGEITEEECSKRIDKIKKPVYST